MLLLGPDLNQNNTQVELEILAVTTARLLEARLLPDRSPKGIVDITEEQIELLGIFNVCRYNRALLIRESIPSDLDDLRLQTRG